MAGDTVDCSVLSLVVFRIEEQRYALHLHAVDQVLPMIEVSPLPKAPAITLGVINLRGRVMPVLGMRQRFGLPPRDDTLSDHLLVARTPRRTLALLVDHVLEVEEVAAEAVTAPAAVLPGIGHVAGGRRRPESLRPPRELLHQ